MPEAFDVTKKRIAVLLPWASVTWLWILFFSRTRLWWGEGSYYTYGWAVPFLTGMLWWKRTVELQSATERDNGLLQKKSGLPIGLFVLLGVYLPLRLIAEPDPFWRLPLWMEGIALCGITLWLARLQHGTRAWRSFAWPLVFLLTALPWPATAETSLVQGLTSLVTAFTAEALLWTGYPAEATGNHILVTGKMVEIDASCSGIRSFQCLLAFSLFFGEYHKLQISLRAATVILGLIFAFLFNLGRALALSLIFLMGDMESYEAWHDFVGYLAVGAAFVSLWAWSLMARSKTKTPEEETVSIKEDAGQKRGISKKKGGQEAGLFRAGRLSRMTTSCFFAFACLLPEAFTFGWFKWVATPEPGPDWTVRWPAEGNVTMQRFPIPKKIEDILLFDHGEGMVLELDSVGKVEAQFFSYDGSDPAASVCSRDHDPATCMRATGVKLLGGQDELIFSAPGGAQLRLLHYVTGPSDAIGRHPLHVFWCPWTKDDRSGRLGDPGASWAEKANRFLGGKVSFERKVLLLTMSGQRSFAKAREDVQVLLEQIVQEAP